MTHQQLMRSSFYQEGHRDQKNVAYFSIPMNLQDKVKIRTDVHALFKLNNWKADWWLDTSAYDDTALRVANAIVFFLPNPMGKSILAFNHYISQLTKGIASEIAKARRLGKPIYIAYYDTTQAVGIYEAQIETLGPDSNRIKGIAGTRNVIFQNSEIKKTDAEYSQEDLAKYNEEQQKQTGSGIVLSRTHHEKLKQFAEAYGHSADIASIRNQYPLTPNECFKVPIEELLSYYDMVRNRGERDSRLLNYGSFVIDLDAIPKVGSLEKMINLLQSQSTLLALKK